MAGKFRVIDPQIKADAIAEVKNQGMPVSQATIKYGVDPSTPPPLKRWIKMLQLNPRILSCKLPVNGGMFFVPSCRPGCHLSFQL